jgi:hypothetical protein
MVVVEIAKSSRSTCRTCNKFIEEQTLRYGTSVSNEGYINIEWHHSTCFWTKRASKYFFRNKKKINTVLKLAQFTGYDKLTPEQKQELESKMLEANLRWGTDVALKKAGIEKPEGEPTPEEEPTKKKAPAKGKKGSKKRTRDQDDDDEEEEKPKEVAETKEEPEVEVDSVPKKKARRSRR